MTEPRFLLDTIICICILQNISARAVARLGECDEGEAVVSAVSVADMLIGAERERPGSAARSLPFFQVVPIVDFDTQAALTYARLPSRRGRFDRLIAAHALSRGVTLVTNDARDFADVPGLKLENWTA